MNTYLIESKKNGYKTHEIKANNENEAKQKVIKRNSITENDIISITEINK